MVAIVRRKLYKQLTIVLLLHLTVIDLLLCVLVMPFNIIVGFAGEYFLGNSDYTRCQVCQTGTIFTVLSFLSLYSVSFISLDRFLFIVKPLKYSKIVTIRTTLALITATWVLCIITSIFPAAGIGKIEFADRTALCTLNCPKNNGNMAYFVILSVVALPPLATLLITNSWLVCIIQKHIRKLYNTSLSNDETLKKLRKRLREEHNQKQLNLIRVFGTLFIANICTWLPILSISLSCLVVQEDMESIPLGYVTFSYLFLHG